MIREFAYGAVAAAALTFAPLAASAATIDVTPMVNDDDWSLVDLGATVALSGADWDGPAAEIETGNLDGQYRSPFADSGIVGWENIEFFNVTIDNTPVNLMFDIAQTALSFLWGSVDSYNWIDFYFEGNGVANYTGDNIIALGAAQGVGAALVTFSGFQFDSVQFHTQGQNAFEFSNISATPIPVPAAGLLLLSALGGMAVIRRRRKDA